MAIRLALSRGTVHLLLAQLRELICFRSRRLALHARDAVFAPVDGGLAALARYGDGAREALFRGGVEVHCVVVGGIGGGAGGAAARGAR